MGQPADSADSFNWSSVAPGDEHYALALEAFYSGRAFPEIVTMLADQGLAPDLIPEVITAVARHRAFFMFSACKSRAEVARVLEQRGLSAVDAAYIAGSVDQARDKVLASVGVGKWQLRSLVAGGVLLTVGFVAYAVGRLGGPVVPGELLAGLLGSGVLLAGLGGVYIAVEMQ
jgi:hypothetical protein